MIVALRAVVESDLPIFYAHQRDEESCRLADFTPRGEPAFMEHWEKILASDDVTARAILCDGAVAGNILCFERDGRHEVGYWISREEWGRGIASEALEQFLDTIRQRPLHAVVAQHNHPSQRVLEKCGFVVVGTAPAPDAIEGDGREDLVLRLGPEEERLRRRRAAVRALDRLVDGNRRFAAGTPQYGARSGEARRNALSIGQRPFAIIVGCSDSRVPAEIVFDQGLGDLFVVRVAGNIVARSQVGSVEFAAESFATPLVVVLGHSGCGAISATLEQLARPETERSPNLASIVGRVRPALEELLDADLSEDQLAQRAVRANVSASVQQLRHGSELIERMLDVDHLAVVGAEYSLETGVVDFFEGVPLAGSEDG